jgi:hypothetical protein
VDKEGNLGFLASWEEIRKYGAGARKVFVRQSPSELNHSNARAVEMGSHQNRPWKRQSGDEWVDGGNRGYVDGHQRFK